MRNNIHQAIELLLHLFESIHGVLLGRLALLAHIITILIHIEVTRWDLCRYLSATHDIRRRIVIIGATRQVFQAVRCRHHAFAKSRESFTIRRGQVVVCITHRFILYGHRRHSELVSERCSRRLYLVSHLSIDLVRDVLRCLRKMMLHT